MMNFDPEPREESGTEMPDTLIINGAIYFRAGTQVEATDCALKTCSYYSHYLIHYTPESGEKLPHTSYHFAEEKLDAAQKAHIAWIDAHLDTPRAVEPPHLEKLASYWERRCCV